MEDYKYIIVGQGLAGSLIALECHRRNIPFIVVDKIGLASASHKAAGIINPITGRKFVKTWLYESLEEDIALTYNAFAHLLGKQYLFERRIIRAIHTVKDQNNWDVRSLTPEAGPYMKSDPVMSDYDGVIHNKMAYGYVNGYQLNISGLVTDFRAWLISQKKYKDEVFDFGALKISENIVQYKGIKAKGIIFCEGYKVIENPFFSELPFHPSKGEVLRVEIPALKTDDLLKDGIFVAPMMDELFWVGSNYNHGDLSEEVTAEGRKWLINHLEQIIKAEYTVKDHVTALRPSTKHRKPLIGTHPKFNNVHLFNGLGTKGSSLGPYFARQTMDFLENGTSLNREVDIRYHFNVNNI